MSWTASTDDRPPTFEGGRQRVTVNYTDGTQKFSTPFLASDADDLSRQVRRTIAAIDAAKTSAKPIQPNTTIDLTPETPSIEPPPSADQLHRAAIYDALQTVRRTRNAWELGVGTDKAHADALAVFRALYLDTDLPLLGGIV